MQRNLTDQQLEILLKNVVAATAADESTIEEVVATPSVWWAVQREIRQHPAATTPSFAKIRHWLLLGIPAAAGAVLLVALFISRTTVPPSVDQVAAVPVE